MSPEVQITMSKNSCSPKTFLISGSKFNHTKFGNIIISIVLDWGDNIFFECRMEFQVGLDLFLFPFLRKSFKHPLKVLETHILHVWNIYT